MLFITELLAVLNQGSNATTFSATNLRHFAHIIESIFSLSHRVTTRSVARISGVSYRTVQRFYALKEVNWTLINLLLFKHFVYSPGKTYLFAADETVVGKAGKSSYGIGHFYSSLARQVIRSVSFLVISIIDIEKEKSYVLGSNQLIHPTTDKSKTDKSKTDKSKTDKAKTDKSKTDKSKTDKAKTDKSTSPSQTTPSGRKGRPKGSKNKVKTESESTSYQVLKTLLDLVQSQLKLFLPALNCFHLVLDGFYGHQQYLLLAARYQLNIISKLKTNAHLILPYQGSYSGVGRPKRLGDKVNLDKIDPKFYNYTLPDTDQTDKSTTDSLTTVYQFEAFTPKMSSIKLNIVVLIHLHLKTKKVSRTILFSTDLTLDAATLIHYYSLRFQIEFDFRDAKQFYGLSDFKNYKQTQLTNAANIAFTLSSIGKILLEKYRNKLGCNQMGILDLKTVFRTCKWAKLLLNKDQITVDEFLNNPNLMHIIRLEAIHL